MPIERAVAAMMKLDAVKRESYPNLARAALAAIEEPSEAMIRAGAAVYGTLPKDVELIWRAMIKAVMEGK